MPRVIPRDVYFVGSNGHESGYLGLKEVLRQCPGIAVGALTWIYLGSSIGATRNPQTRLRTSNNDMANLAVEALEVEKVVRPPSRSIGAVPRGESRDIYE